MTNSMDWAAMEALLIRLGEALEQETELVLIGSAVCMCLGQPARMTLDFDVWHPSSNYDLSVLKRACEKVGLAFDPKSVVEPEKAYIQIVRPGIVHLGAFSKTSRLLKTGKLVVLQPPTANLVASKLVRCEDKDLDDCTFLLRQTNTSIDEVAEVIETFTNEEARKTAKENITLLQEYLNSCDGERQGSEKKDTDS